MMDELEVRIVTLEPTLVASAYGFGPSPELEAWNKIMAYAESEGLLEKPHRFFGFNNPSPSPGSPNYGYEQWITVGPAAQPTGDVRIAFFPGGLYGVTRLKGLSRIGEVWQQLVLWREDSPYKRGYHQWLEELLVDPSLPMEEYVFDLYLPIVE
jgi:DNA gyrase inhibitor GyrI